MLLSKAKLIGVGASLLITLGIFGFIGTKMYSMNTEISQLKIDNTKLITDNTTLKENVITEKHLREDTEKVLEQFKSLSKDNKETDRTSTVFIEKVRQVDLKLVNADTINNLVSELNKDWKC